MRLRVAQFALVVPDYDAAIAFYVGVLGFELLEDTDMGNGKRWVLVGPSRSQHPQAAAILLARAVTPEQSSRVGDQTGGRVFLFLHTDDFDRDHARLVAAGVKFIRERTVESYGVVGVFLDPFGNKVDLIQPR